MVIKKRKYGIFDFVSIPVMTAPVSSLIIILQMISIGIVPTVQVIVTARFIDTAISITKGETVTREIYGVLFAVVILIAYIWIIGGFSALAQTRMELKMRTHFRSAITDRRAGLAYKNIEDNKTWDLISRIADSPETKIKDAFSSLLALISNFVRIGGILILLITEVWWAAVVIISFSVPLFMLAIKSGNANYEANRQVTKNRRIYEYLTSILTGRDSVDERTLFGYGPEVSKKWYTQYETARKTALKTEKKWFIKMKTGSLITALISFLIVIVLLGPVLSGRVTVGMFISLVTAVFGLVQVMSWELTYNTDQLAKNKEYMKDLTEFASLQYTQDTVSKPATPPPIFDSLEFKNVTFNYPGTDNYVLKNMSFRMEKGKHYAFVGLNGAGKTTVTKLVTGLYDGYTGDIILNGRDIREYSQNEIKAFFAVVYQDFARYSISVKDNIQIGDIHETGSMDHTIDLAGLTETIEKLPQGIDTPLGKIKEDGMDISGGEWQRIAMARAVINPAPLLILDEPTASLDPVSESRLYAEFENISRSRTTIFISHRLGSTKLADEILVIDNGYVAEKGTHAELMDHNGIYSGMYESQRSWYQ